MKYLCLTYEAETTLDALASEWDALRRETLDCVEEPAGRGYSPFLAWVRHHDQYGDAIRGRAAVAVWPRDGVLKHCRTGKKKRTVDVSISRSLVRLKGKL